MYRTRLWQKSFIVSYASPEETNAGFLKNLEKGITGCRVTEDLPSQMGLDPDHPLAWNSMMCGGVSAYAINVFAETMAVLDDFIARGHTIDEYKSMVFALDSDSDFFETIAKYRCARRMWAKITKDRYGAKKESTMKQMYHR